jgi:hypothetical protein
MATTPPRRVLGLLDANKARGQSPLIGTPGKAAGRLTSSASIAQGMAAGKSSRLSPQKPVLYVDGGSSVPGSKRKFADAPRVELSPNKLRRVFVDQDEGAGEAGEYQNPETLGLVYREEEDEQVHGERAEMLLRSGVCTLEDAL